MEFTAAARLPNTAGHPGFPEPCSNVVTDEVSPRVSGAARVPGSPVLVLPARSGAGPFACAFTAHFSRAVVCEGVTCGPRTLTQSLK